MKPFFKYVYLISVFIIALTSPILGEGCPDCKRKAVVGKCENLALPDDFNERAKEWYDCMTTQMGYSPGEEWFATEDNMAAYDAAKESCKALEPDYGRKFSEADGEFIRSVLEAALVTNFRTERFRLISFSQPSAGTDPGSSEPEYIFEATYDCARIPNVDIVDKQESYPSVLTLKMYHNGDKKELIKEWSAESPNHELDPLVDRLIYNDDAPVRIDAPLINLTDRFESMPASCTIQPEKETCSYNTKMTITIKDLRDAFGKKSREFCRIAVAVKEGRILNGATPRGVNEGKIAVFQVGGGNVEVEYEAPDTSLKDSETVTVYHCHDVSKLAAVPLARTAISKKTLSEKEIPFSLPGVTAIIKITYKASRKENRVTENKKRINADWNEEKHAEVMYTFYKEPRESRSFDPSTGKIHVTRYRYMIKDVTILSAGSSGSGSSTSDSDNPKTHVEAQSNYTGTHSELELESAEKRLTLDVDPETGKIHRAVFPQALIHGHITGMTTGVQIIGGNTYDMGSERDEDDTLTVSQNYGDYDADDPYSVTDGDGKTILKGGLDSVKKEKYGQKEYASSWTVIITPEQ